MALTRIACHEPNHQGDDDDKASRRAMLANNLFWSAGSVADLYRCRWQIEVFFKQIKQSLQLRDFQDSLTLWDSIHAEKSSSQPQETLKPTPQTIGCKAASIHDHDN
jgi:IS4 transposase